MGKVMDTYKNIDNEEKQEIKDIVKTLFKTSFSTIKEELPQIINRE